MSQLSRIAILLIGAPFYTAPAVAAVWETSHMAISSDQDNATLGVSGRNAVVDLQGRVHLFFQNNLGGDSFEIMHTIRGVNLSWSTAATVSPPEQSARNASAVVAQDGRIHVIWEDVTDGEGEIVHRILETDGSWSDPTLVSPAEGFSRQPVVTIDAFDKTHVVWVDSRGGSQKVLHSSLASGSTLWSPANVLSLGGTVPIEPDINSDALGTVYVVWSDRGPPSGQDPNYEISFVRIEPGGSVSVPTILVENPANAVRPFIEALEDGTLHVVWLDGRVAHLFTYYEIFYKRYLPGIGWSKEKRFTYDGTDHGRPVIVAGPGQSLNIAWEDYRSGAPDIFFRQITWERGWDREATQITADISSSQAPTLLTTDDGQLLMMWTDAQGSGVFRIVAKVGEVESSP